MSSIKELVEQLVVGVEREIGKKDREISRLKSEIEDLQDESESECIDCKNKDAELDKMEKLLAAPIWGNCLRGCQPAYLVNGFCSPSCENGGARGQFYSVPEEKNVLPISQAS